MPETSLDLLLRATPLPTVVINESEWIIAANAEALKMFSSEMVGRHFTTVLRQPQVITAIEATLADHGEHLARHRLGSADQDAPLDVTCRYIEIAGQGEPGAAVVSFQDRADMEHAGQMRRDFVANVSHELRTPLTALIGFIDTLRGPARDDSEARDRFLTIMEQEAGRMNRLVGDLLSLSRVEAEERVRPTGRVELGPLLSSTLSSLTPLADANGIALTVAGPDQPVVVPGDEDQLRQVFTNLIENGIKYGGAGKEVALTIRLCDRDAALRVPAAMVEVRDKGPGIDPIHLPRLTERFYRGDNHRSRQLGGTGLGLAIAKHIVNRHRGRMKVASEPGEGATFTVILPRQRH
ncbi:sensor histidine kinase [Sedimentitalea todarodis]|uniref:histidine kinase n=1 Tax=Sedimentitalea todarodis TaxID=1631240 RepID=A0ABU3VAR4_9RHOB|nr:ATP-binding protein [Sedimentitalea todarodis]MDU9003266.1 ATP-binding protein [Sedimentitalea todarodis]